MISNFLRTLKNAPKVIITTAYPNYALDGFELDVMDYLLKPFSFERFIKAVNKFPSDAQSTVVKNNEEIVANPIPDHIFVKMDRSFQKVLLNNIMYFESDKDFVKIHTTEKYYMELQSLKHYEETLPENFIRIHKSFIINKDKLETIESSRLIINDQKLPVGRNYKDQLFKKLGL